MDTTTPKSAKELTRALNISHNTFKKRIKEKIPAMYAIWYNGKRKDLYYPSEIKIILEQAM